MRGSTRPIHNILHQPRSGLEDILAHVRELQNIAAVLEHIMPESLAAHTELANVRGQVLTLIADSPAWATRLRYQREMLIWRLQSELGLTVRELQVKVVPRQQVQSRAAPARRPQGAPRRHLLQAAGQEVDPELAGALRRLAGPEAGQDQEHVPD